MRTQLERPPGGDPTARAIEDLRFIRATMERSESFTAVSGRALVAVGAIALAAAVLCAFVVRAVPGSDAWIGVWAASASLASVLGGAALFAKARRHGLATSRGAGRKLLLGFGGPLVAGVVLTCALVRIDARVLLPGTWLSLYGAGVVAAGAFSTRSVPWLGGACMALGAAALFAPLSLADGFLAAGFGLLHLVVGWRIARRHGG